MKVKFISANITACVQEYRKKKKKKKKYRVAMGIELITTCDETGKIRFAEDVLVAGVYQFRVTVIDKVSNRMTLTPWVMVVPNLNRIELMEYLDIESMCFTVAEGSRV